MVQSILFLGSQMETAGAQEMLLTQARWFHEQGNRVLVVFFYDKEGCHDDWSCRYPFPIVNLNGWEQKSSPINGFRLLRGFFRLGNLMTKSHFDIIETFTHHANFLGLPLAWLFRIPVRVATHHGIQESFPGWLAFFYKMLINSPMTSCLVAVSQQVKEYSIHDEGIDAEKIHVIPNGLDFSRFKEISPEEKRTIRRRLNLVEDGPVLLTIARLAAPKGHTILIQAAPLVMEKHPQAAFLFAGDGSLRAELEEQAGRLGISQAVHFLGVRSDIPDLLSIADVFVLPSLTEGLPVALLEAMAAGLPVIASRVGGVETLVTDELTGLTVPAGDPEGLSRAIIRLLDDRNAGERLGRAAQSYIRTHYSAERMCAAYQRLFDLRGES
jgi:glycosyltransferase involved in cell wall biosynthesis